jgi:hypothetical protein
MNITYSYASHYQDAATYVNAFSSKISPYSSETMIADKHLTKSLVLNQKIAKKFSMVEMHAVLFNAEVRRRRERVFVSL